MEFYKSIVEKHPELFEILRDWHQIWKTGLQKFNQNDKKRKISFTKSLKFDNALLLYFHILHKLKMLIKTASFLATF